MGVILFDLFTSVQQTSSKRLFSSVKIDKLFEIENLDEQLVGIINTMKHEALNKEFFQGNEEMYEIYDNILKVCKDHCSKDLEKRLSHLTKDQAEVIKMCLRLDPKNRAGVQ